MRFTFVSMLCMGMSLSVIAAGPDVTAKVIDKDVYYQQPLGPCEIPGAVIQIAKAVQVPVGVEPVPEICRSSGKPATPAVDPPHRDRIFLTGKTVAQALNELIAADPRYYWGESDGVIVMRPVTAWADKRHFLHRTLPSVRIVDQNLGGALDVWRRAMWGADAPPPSDHMSAGQRTEEASRLFTVAPDGPHTAIEALDRIIRAHGALYWEVTYCQPPAEARHATVWLRTLEHDPPGWGVPAVSFNERSVTMNGKRVDPCGGRM
jgi:hypothetical protein